MNMVLAQLAIIVKQEAQLQDRVALEHSIRTLDLHQVQHVPAALLDIIVKVLETQQLLVIAKLDFTVLLAKKLKDLSQLFAQQGQNAQHDHLVILNALQELIKLMKASPHVMTALLVFIALLEQQTFQVMYAPLAIIVQTKLLLSTNILVLQELITQLKEQPVTVFV